MQSKKKRPKKIRRNTSTILYVGLTAALSVVAALAITTRPANNATAEPSLRIVNEDDMTLIPAPARAVARGERMSAVPIAMLQWPKSKVSAEYLTDIANYKDAIALTALPKLLPIPTSALTTSDADLNGVTDSIPAGMRAVTVRVDAQSAVEGWAQSGSHVDVILLKPDPGQKSGVRSRIIAQDIKVLSVNSIAEPNRSDQVASKAPSTVTLLTSQQDALKITTAANLGRLMFALRGADDRKPLEITELGSAEFDDAEIVKGPEEDYQGMAQANGKTFVLGRGKRWMETTEKQKGADSARAALSTESPDDMVLDAAPVAAAPSKMP